MIYAEVLGVEKLNEELAKAPDVFKRFMKTAMQQATIKIQATTKANYLSGQALQRRTNNLSGSIHRQVDVEGDAVVGRVGTNVVYGAVHEFGGTFQIPAHNRGGQPVKAHSATYKARPFLGPAYKDNASYIKDIFRAACAAAAKELR